MQKKIRAGLLGTGFMCKAHGNAYRTIPYMFPQLEGLPLLDTVASSVQGHAKQAAKRYGFLQGVEG